jgi:alanyl-tRNA synthetase
LKSSRESLEERIATTIDELKLAQRKLAAMQAEQLATLIPDIVLSAETVGSFRFAIKNVGMLGDVDELRTLTLQLRDRMQNDSAVVALFAEISGKPMIVIALTKQAQVNGAKAGALVKIASSVLGGGGGGKDDTAQGGGTDLGKIDLAISAIRSELTK